MTGRLGLDVSLQGLRHVRPGLVRYEGLELADPETGDVVFRCPVLEAQWTKDRREKGPRRPLLVLNVSGSEIDFAALGQLGQLLHRILRRQGGRPEVDVRLSCGKVTLRSDGGSQTLTELQGRIDHLEGGSQARATFRLADGELAADAADGPIEVRVVRNRQTTPPTTGFELHTGSQSVPCRLLALAIPWLEPLGPQSRFAGYIWANQMAIGRWPMPWHGEVAGRFLDVDLGSLVTGRLPHKLTGTAQLTVHSARFRQQRLEEARGELVLGPGMIGRSLIDAAAERLHLVRRPQRETPGDLVPYQQLAVAFRIDSYGLKLQGRCPTAGAILIGRQGPMLDEPAAQPQPVAALLQTLVLVGDRGDQVPATRQTDWLMRRLPLPKVARFGGP